jgi:hypothetical protein
MRLRPLLLKLFAAGEVAGGAVLATGLLREMAHTQVDWVYQFMVECIVAVAVGGGISLWRGEPPGFLLSCVLQFLQSVAVFTRRFTFGLLLGPGLSLAVPTVGAPDVEVGLRAAMPFYIGPARPEVATGYTINFAAILLLIALLHFQRVSGQPWVRPRGTHAVWDRARLIGAYQIGAGVLGVINARYAPTYAMADLVFGLVVVASGVALVLGARWATGAAIAVNAIQVPAFSTGRVAFLVRSGLSCIVAIVSGQESGLHVQFDVGSVINHPLASGVEAFVGINLTALALVCALARRPDGRASVAGKPKRFVIKRF